ncbi:hypothetical protein PPF1_11 [Rhizobium phage vB_RleM_PPF1]|uniref:hypothetical protein n=1 Tax=Rhizobium phage vB_RleM_PPF1 TaxID=1498228 RepID=UPI00049A3F03|nr:hypothetical protein PPF1_11 [Rhizobium phage vB_RleM_PPF1]AID18324.1 hypothetical protein PPF1_11 [Rhizobium phage vB_RleM_PPF1]
MLSAEAVRLAAIEILCPTAAAIAGSGFPTLAGRAVFDSRAAPVEDLDRKAPYTPVLSLYTPQSGFELRAEAASADDTVAYAVLDVIAELAVVNQDGEGEFADAMAATDPDARLVLAALCAQVRYLLDRSQAGGLWRGLVSHIKADLETFAVPNLGLRWQRVTMRFRCGIRDDDFDMADGGLPQPIRRLYEALPEESYAKAKLGALAAFFVAEELPPFEGGDAYGPEN